MIETSDLYEKSCLASLQITVADHHNGAISFFFFAHFFIMAISANLTTFIILNTLTIPTISKSSSSLPSSRFALSSPFSPFSPFSPSKSSFGARSYHPHLHYTLPPLEPGVKTDYNDNAFHGLISSFLFLNNNCHVLPPLVRSMPL